MKCPYCHHANPASATRCLHCSRALPLARKKGISRRMKSALLNAAIVFGTIVMLFAFLIGGFHFFNTSSSSTTAYVSPGSYYDDNGDYYDDNVYEYTIEPDTDRADDIYLAQEDVPAADTSSPASNSAVFDENNQEQETVKLAQDEPVLGAEKNAARGSGPMPELLSNFYNSSTGLITLPDSGVHLIAPFEGVLSVNATTARENPMILLDIDTESGLLYNIACSRLDTAPGTLIDTEQSGSRDLYASIGGEDLLYYYVFQPTGMSVMANVVDVEHCWTTQITITDRNAASSSSDGTNRKDSRPYQAMLRLLAPLERTQSLLVAD